MDAAVRRSWIRGGVFGVGAIGAVQVSSRLGPVVGTAAGLVAAAAAAYGEPAVDQWWWRWQRRRGSRPATPLTLVESLQRDLRYQEGRVKWFRARLLTSPDYATRDFTYVLNAQAVTLAQLGRPYNAVAAAAEAVDLMRVLAGVWPAAFNAALAENLDRLSRYLVVVGRHQDAHACSVEAVDLQRGVLSLLPAESPKVDDVRAELAAYLQDLSNRHSLLGDDGEAVVAAEEAVALFSHPSEPSPARLGSALGTLAGHRFALGHPEQALQDARAALGWLKLAAAHGEDVSRDLSFALGTTGWILDALGRQAEAVPPARQAVDLERSEVAALPGVREPNLVWALRCLAEATAPTDAVAALTLAEEAERVARASPAGLPSSVRALAEALGCRADLLAQLGRHDEALPVLQQAEAAWQQLEASDPASYRKHLAMEQYNVAAAFGRLQRWDEAVEQASVAVDSFVDLAPADFDANAGSLAEALFARGRFLASQASPAQALPDLREAARYARDAAVRNPRLFARLDVFITDVVANLRQAGVPEAEIDQLLADLHPH